MSDNRTIEQLHRRLREVTAALDSLLALVPEPAEDGCMEESCRYRHWRSGSMPTHTRGADCPPLVPEPPTDDETLSIEDVYERLIEHHTLDELVEYAEQQQFWCCNVGCGSGGCETCPCCSAGWCVSGRHGLPEDADDLAQWLEVAAEHNPAVAALCRPRPLDRSDADLSALQRSLFEECEVAGWDPEKRNTFAEECAHLHEEVSEAFREWRLFKDFEIRYDADGKPTGIPIEFADVLIGLFYNAELHGFDLLAAVELKHRYNLTRDYQALGRQLHPVAVIEGQAS